MKKPPFKLRSGNTPLKQSVDDFIHSSDSSTVYDWTQSANQGILEGINPDISTITDLNVKREGRGDWSIYPTLEDNVLPEHDVTTSKEVGGLENVSISERENLSSSVISQFSSKTGSANVTYNPKTNIVTGTQKSTSGYVIKKPDPVTVKLDIDKDVSLIPTNINEDFKLLQKKFNIKREKKKGFAKLWANRPVLRIQKNKGVKVKKKTTKNLVTGGTNVTKGLWKLPTIKFKWDKAKTSIYKPLTDQQITLQKINKEIKKFNIEATKYNVESAKKHGTTTGFPMEIKKRTDSYIKKHNIEL